MTNVSDYSEIDCRFLQGSSRGGTANATATATAGVLCNLASFIRLTSRVMLQDSLGQSGHKFAISLLPCESCLGASSSARRRVGGAFALGLGQRLFSHQQSLALVPFACPTETHHNGGERTVLASAAC